MFQPVLQRLHPLRRVLKLGHGPDHLERPSHGRDDVRHGSNVAPGEDVIRRSHELGETRGFGQRVPGEIHAPFDGVDVSQEVDARARSGLGLVESLEDAGDARLEVLGLELDAIDLGDGSGDALQARDGLLLEREGDVLGDEL